ncbi:MAG TPA: diguanylate cyclase, partial [Desulfobacteria bacterium]|nr:diguanylate cyclase [Desulfobacteria bacterium]
MMKLDWIPGFNNMAFIVRTSLIIVAIIPLLVFLLTSNYYITSNFWDLEAGNVREQAGHAAKGIDVEATELGKFAKDYAVWNEFYDKLNQNDVAWFKENVIDWLPQNQGVDLVVIANKEKQVVDEFGLIPGSEKEILEDAAINGILTRNYNQPHLYPGGLKLYRGELYIIAVSPVLKSFYKGKPAGMLVLGRKVTPRIVSNIKNMYGHDVFFYYSGNLIANKQDMPIFKGYLDRFSQLKGIDVIQIGDTRIMGVAVLHDISGKTVGRLFAIGDRDMFFSTLALVHRNGYAVLALSIGIILLLSVRMKNVIVAPINDLELQISQMAAGGSLSSVRVQGPQEIQSLAIAFNSLSASLQAHKQENIGLKNITITDDLTSLYNHRYFYEYLKTELLSGTKRFSLLFGDLDYFKVVNDVHGHIVGDLILRETARIITTIIGNGDKVFRYGGEEFAVLVDGYDPQQVFETAEKIRIAVETCPEIQHYSGYFPVTISIGIAFCPDDAKSAEGLVAKADRAMYFAKKSGRNQCKFYSAYMDSISGEDSENVAKQEMLIDSTYSLAAAIDAKDSYTEKHSELVTKYSLLLAEKLNLS